MRAQIAQPEPLAVPDHNDDIPYLPAKYHVPLWYGRKDISKIILTLLTHLCKYFSISPAGKSSIPQQKAVALDAYFDIVTGAMQKAKSPKEINLQIHPTSPQLPYVSYSISNCP